MLYLIIILIIQFIEALHFYGSSQTEQILYQSTSLLFPHINYIFFSYEKRGCLHVIRNSFCRASLLVARCSRHTHLQYCLLYLPVILATSQI